MIRLLRYARIDPPTVTFVREGDPIAYTAAKVHYSIPGRTNHDRCCPLWFPNLRTVFGRLLR